MPDTETITLPRPKPDELIMAACDEHGAIVHIIAKKGTLQAGEIRDLLPFFAEGQEMLHAGNW